MAFLIPGDGFGDGLQECLLAEGVELEEHGLAAAGCDGGKAYAMGRFQEQDTQTHPVAAQGAVPLIDPQYAPARAALEVALVLHRGGEAALQHSGVNGVQHGGKVPVQGCFQFCHYLSS